LLRWSNTFIEKQGIGVRRLPHSKQNLCRKNNLNNNSFAPAKQYVVSNKHFPTIECLYYRKHSIIPP
jgi:hypothetical protein